MQMLDSHIGDGLQYAVPTRPQGFRYLENAASQYLPSLYRGAYRNVGEPHDAEDAVQDALSIRVQAFGSVQGNGEDGNMANYDHFSVDWSSECRTTG